MIKISFLFGELMLLGIWLAVRGIFALCRRRIEWKREAMLLLMYFNLAVILRFAFFPMQRIGGRVQPLLFDASALWPLNINWVPFSHLSDYESRRDLLLNLIGNFAMFIPSGILFPLLDRKVTNFPKTVLASAALSLAIELLQLPFAVRTSDVEDLILNTAGAALGGAIFFAARAVRSRQKGMKDEKRTTGSA